MSDTLVEFKSNQGQTYKVPKKYSSALSVSDVIRKMSSDGIKTGEISKVTGIRYQHVRNVLKNPPKKK